MQRTRPSGAQSPGGVLTQIKCHFLGKVDSKSRFVQVLKSRAAGRAGWESGTLGEASQDVDTKPAVEAWVSSEGEQKQGGSAGWGGS